jgi:OOP family OmpA-OmpF porin
MRITSSAITLCAIVLSVCFFAAPKLHAQMSFQKLPPTVNLPTESELAPVISVDGKTLFFARARVALDSSNVVDIWRSTLGADGEFTKAEVVGGRLGSRYGIAVTSVSPDNNTLYLMGKFEEETPPDERIFVSHRTQNDWSIPEPIRIKNLNARGYYTDYSFGPNQKTLIMSIDRDSALGDRDLYVSFFDESKNNWGTPLWLGAQINSRWGEMTPYLAADGKTLYFSSNRPGGLGEVDVYRTQRLDDSWQNWSAPENLGPTINRPGRTLYYSEDAKGEFAYFIWRANTTDQSDIYKAKVPKPRANAVALLKGRVTDPSGKPLLARIRYERLSDGKELGAARSDPKTGDYQISLSGGEDYAVHAELENYVPTSERFDLRNLTEFKTIEHDLVLTKLETGAVVRLSNIFFETDKAVLLPESFSELARLKELLDKNAALRISIDGHTDSTGSVQHNRTLSHDRAEAVRTYLTQQGIDATRLELQAFGPDHPVTSNATEEGRAKNRRVEFRVLGAAHQ